MRSDDKRRFNHGAIGNAGGGNPSVKDKIWHKEKWENETNVRELEAKIATGVYSVKDVYLLKALKADTPILKNMADKVLATLIDHSTNGKDLPVPLFGYVSTNDSDKKDQGNDEATTDCTGRDIGLEDSFNLALPD